MEIGLRPTETRQPACALPFNQRLQCLAQQGCPLAKAGKVLRIGEQVIDGTMTTRIEQARRALAG